MAGLSGDEYSNLVVRLKSLAEHLEERRDGAKAAAKHYPSTAATKLGEADAYDDAATYLHEFVVSLPK